MQIFYLCLPHDLPISFSFILWIFGEVLFIS
jgi:hypothetical protein